MANENYETAQIKPKKMSRLKRIVLGAAIGVPVVLVGIETSMLGYEKFVLQRQVNIIEQIPYEQRTLKQQVFLEEISPSFVNPGMKKYTLEHHPELQDKKMKEIDPKKYYDEYNYGLYESVIINDRLKHQSNQD